MVEQWGEFSSQKPSLARKERLFDIEALSRFTKMMQQQKTMEAQYFARRGMKKPVPTLTVIVGSKEPHLF